MRIKKIKNKINKKYKKTYKNAVISNLLHRISNHIIHPLIFRINMCSPLISMLQIYFSLVFADDNTNTFFQ